MNSKWVVILIAAIITLISFVYAFVQTVKAQAAEREAFAQKTLAEEQRKLSEVLRAEVDKQRVLYMKCQLEMKGKAK